jgi:hypothetical protein
VYSFYPETLKWKTLTALDRPVAYAVAGLRPVMREGAPSSALVFAGGVDGEGMQPRVQTLEDDHFSSRRAAIPARTVLAAGGVHGSTLIMCGGAPDTIQLANACRDTWALDLETLQVTPRSPYPGPPLFTAASAMDLFGRLHIFGGATWDEKAQTVVNLDEAYAFELKNNAWKKLRPLPYAARGMCAVELSQEAPQGGSIVKIFIYLAGGYKNDSEGFTDQAFLYNPAKDQYLPAPPLPYKASVSLLQSGGFVYCLGGEDKKQSRTDAFYRIKLAELLPE